MRSVLMLIYHLTILAESLLINQSGLTVPLSRFRPEPGGLGWGGVGVGGLALYVPCLFSNPLDTTFIPWCELNCVPHPLQIHMLKSHLHQPPPNRPVPRM